MCGICTVKYFFYLEVSVLNGNLSETEKILKLLGIPL